MINGPGVPSGVPGLTSRRDARGFSLASGDGLPKKVVRQLRREPVEVGGGVTPSFRG